MPFWAGCGVACLAFGAVVPGGQGDRQWSSMRGVGRAIAASGMKSFGWRDRFGPSNVRASPPDTEVRSIDE
jgi:hypothetical protein